jgi:hypothetical protein
VNPSPERCAYPGCYRSPVFDVHKCHAPTPHLPHPTCHPFTPVRHCSGDCYHGPSEACHPFTPEPPSQKNDPSTEEMWRKKPVVIAARQLTDLNGLEIAEWCDGELLNVGDLLIRTSEGDMRASIGDFIIRGVKGEFYPCKPDIFAATYERADMPAAPSTSEKVVESLIEKFVVDTCCGGRDVWHVDESKHCHAGPMKQIGNERHETGPNTYMNFYECVACHERAWVGLDADRRIVTERSDG